MLLQRQQLFIATAIACWRLDQLPVEDQVDELVFNEEYAEALSLTVRSH